MGSCHEHHPSLWVRTGPTESFPTLDGDRTCDVVVIGAGITGVTTARLLVSRGVDVVLIDAGPVCAGVTGYTTAKVTALHRVVYDELLRRHGEERARAYADANQAAVESIASLAEADGVECDLVRAPAVTYTQRDDEQSTLEQEAEAARRLGLPVEMTTDTSLPFDVRAAIRLDEQLHFHPRKYCVGLARAITENGGAVFEGTRATDVNHDDQRLRVETRNGRLSAEHVVLATHLPFLGRGAYFTRAHPYRSYALSARLRGPAPTEMYISVEEPTRSVRPAPDGEVVIGGQGHKTGQDPHAEQNYDALETWARNAFDVEAIDDRWSAQDYQSVDGMPYVGQLTAREERIFVATGFRKWGMTNGTAAAEIITEAILGGESAWASAFDSTRTAARASIFDFVRQNADVARHFVGDRISGLSAPDSSDLATGQGAIVKHEGQRVAGYRDENGELHAVSPSCTHLGCQLSFNNAELTWECPCHGSRFDVDGRVLAGPAVEDLEPRPKRSEQDQSESSASNRASA